MLWTELAKNCSSGILIPEGPPWKSKIKTLFRKRTRPQVSQPVGNTVYVVLNDYSVLATSYKCGPCIAHATTKSQGGGEGSRRPPRSAASVGNQLRFSHFSASPRLRGTTVTFKISITLFDMILLLGDSSFFLLKCRKEEQRTLRHLHSGTIFCSLCPRFESESLYCFSRELVCLWHLGFRYAPPARHSLKRYHIYCITYVHFV